jgi:hypothetical protein
LGTANDRNAHPLARGIAAFFGTKALQDTGAERGRTEQAIAKAEAETKRLQREQDVSLKREGLDIQRQGVDNQQLGQENQQAQFDERLKLDRDKFNQEVTRDAQKNAFTKIKSADGTVDLLFKGNAPVNDGLDKGLQWGVDKDGNRVAVPIPQQKTEKASQQKELMLSIVDRLLKNKDGLNSIYGPIDNIIPNTFDTTREAETDMAQLTNILTADNLDLMSGVLSETDIKIIAGVAGGGLAKTNTQEGARKALVRLKTSLTGKKSKEESEDKKTSSKVIDFSELPE